ncbi:MAG: citrate lyase acyl carrier protein [Oscillospiraceae bacterium]|nr:citrate lyase acyl carrier protein [Oscillospiraceae bacterium]
MQIVKNAVAGTLESSDAYVEIKPAETLNITVESVVQDQFGEDIRNAVADVLSQQGVTKAGVRVVDRGALECVIRARVETAVVRGKGEA